MTGFFILYIHSFPPLAPFRLPFLPVLYSMILAISFFSTAADNLLNEVLSVADVKFRRCVAKSGTHRLPVRTASPSIFVLLVLPCEWYITKLSKNNRFDVSKVDRMVTLYILKQCAPFIKQQ